MGPAWYGVLWAVETEWNRHRESISNAIDSFEPSIEGETAIVQRETRQSYPPAWQWSATCRKSGQDILGSAEIGLTPPSIISRRCSFRLTFVSIYGKRPGSSAFPFLWRSQKIRQLPERWQKLVVSDGLKFWEKRAKAKLYTQYTRRFFTYFQNRKQ